MTEKLSAFVADTPKNRSEDLKQAKINDLLDQRQALLDSGKSKDDPEVLAISQSLLEMTDPQISHRTAEVESLLLSIKKKLPQTDPTADQDNATRAKSADNLYNELKRVAEKIEQSELGDALKFIKKQQSDIDIARSRLLLELFPQLDKSAQSYIRGELAKFDEEYALFESKVYLSDDQYKISLLRGTLGDPLENWFNRIFDLYKETAAIIKK